MAGKRKKQRSWYRKLGWALVFLGVVSVPVFGIRLFQIWDLYVFFEEVGRVGSATRAWWLRVWEDGMIVLFALALGNYLRVESSKVSRSLVWTSIILAVYLLYRFGEELFIILSLI